MFRLAILLILIATPALATDVSTLSKQATDAFEKGNYTEAIDLWQRCIGAAQSAGAGDLSKMLSDSPAEFGCGEIETESMNVGGNEENMQWTMVRRRCTRDRDGAVLTLSVTDSPLALEGMRALATSFQNEQMIQMMKLDPESDFETVEVGSWTGWIHVQSGQSQLVLLSASTMFQAELNVADAEPLREVADNLD